MRLYMHPVSSTSRPILLYIADNNLPVEEVAVDLMAGAQHQEPYITLNPNHLVPTLVDGDFVLTESSAILKYLADKFDLATYPKELQPRAKVNEMMDWFNANLYRDYAYGVVYPQIFPHHKRPSDEIQKSTIDWNRERTRKWFQVLNDYWLSGGADHLVGDGLTIADYFGAGLLTCGDVIRADFKAYPNIAHWLANMAKQPSWAKVNEALYGFRDALKDRSFETV